MRRQTLIGLPLAGTLLLAGCAADAGGGSRSPLEVGTTPEATAAGSTTETAPASGPSGTPAPTNGGTAATTVSHAAGPAGSVTLLVDGRTVTLDGVELAADWQQSGEPRLGDELRIDFVGPDDRQVRFEAEVERDDTLDIDVEERRALADGTTTVDLPEGAGRATFTVAGSRISLDGLAPADGWEVRERERDDDSFDVDLVHADRQLKVELSVEIDDGRLELDTETRHGSGFESGDDDADDDADDD